MAGKVAPRITSATNSTYRSRAGWTHRLPFRMPPRHISLMRRRCCRHKTSATRFALDGSRANRRSSRLRTTRLMRAAKQLPRAARPCLTPRAMRGPAVRRWPQRKLTSKRWSIRSTNPELFSLMLSTRAFRSSLSARGWMPSREHSSRCMTASLKPSLTWSN